MYDFTYLVGRVTQQTVFNAAGIYTIDIPRWARNAFLYMVGPGGGGGGGGSNTSVNAKGGGGGGGGGGRIMSMLPTNMLLNASLQLFVGDGGRGGVTGADGATAGNGTMANWATHAYITWGSTLVHCGIGNAGGGGFGGGAGAGAVGTAGTTTAPTIPTILYANSFNAVAGGAGGAIGGMNGTSNATGVTAGGAGGGSLGASAGSNFAGGQSNSPFPTLIPSLPFGVAGAAEPGGNGSSIFTPFPLSLAGSGGGTSFNGNGGNGGNGAFGCGGGGGGAGLIGGSGGRGGDGLIIVGFW